MAFLSHRGVDPPSVTGSVSHRGLVTNVNQGQLTATLGNLTLLGSGSVLIGGRLTSTLANLSLSAQGSVVDRATITQRLVVEGYSNDNLSTYSTAIGDPVDGEWHYLAVWSEGNAATPPVPPSSIVGAGLNWQAFLAAGWDFGSGNSVRNLTIWRAQADLNAVNGALSINYPSAILGCAWVWCAFTGVARPTSVQQSDVDVTSSGVDPSVTLAAFEHPNNLFIATYARSTNAVVSPPSGFTALGAQGPSSGFLAVWVALGQTTCAPTGPGIGAAALHGLELVAGGV